ncbi:hypothetical protein FVE85_7490 [Porphyridium purpureum]|uniref:Endoplasmic reticulum transmembrane protein n=1 Tax=Porphyridium purpureum TaxID=35688 RepID=A0A5J4Z992_PORPP|nr:hypothetical protein FVE85_7490 [Porphyridium purpureum]|eukprot:POR1445..scf295_1
MAKSIVWMAVFCLLVFELVLVVLLCLPLPWGMRKFVVKLVGSAKGIHHVQTGIVFLLLALTLAFASSVQEMLFVTEKSNAYKFELSSASGYEVWEYSKLRQEKFRSERNMYLSLFCLTLSLVLRRLFELFANEVQLRSQLEGASKGTDAPAAQTEKAGDKKGN